MPSETDKLYHELTGQWPTNPDVPLPSQSLYEDTHGVPLMEGRNPSRLLMVVLPFIVLFWGGALLVAMLVFRR